MCSWVLSICTHLGPVECTIARRIPAQNTLISTPTSKFVQLTNQMNSRQSQPESDVVAVSLRFIVPGAGQWNGLDATARSMYTSTPVSLNGQAIMFVDACVRACRSPLHILSAGQGRQIELAPGPERYHVAFSALAEIISAKRGGPSCEPRPRSGPVSGIRPSGFSHH